MLGITAALLLQTSVVVADLSSNNYAAAHRRTIETGQPLLVLVGADWCPGCRTMKQSVIPQAQQSGLLNGVAFAVVNTDREPALAGQLMRGRSIPQLIMYRKTEDGWRRRQLTGATSVEALRSFLAQPAPAESTKVSERPDNEGTVGR